MRIRLLTIALVAGLASLAAAQEPENPFKKAKVGDYVAYKLTTAFGGKDITLETKKIVTAKDDKEVTLKATTMIAGKELPGQSTKIDLTKPFDPVAVALGKGKGKFEKTDEGKEKITIGDKTYDCTWQAGKVVAEAKGQKIESDVKMWYAKNVPLTGMVKMEIKSNLANVKMELTGSGNEKP